MGRLLRWLTATHTVGDRTHYQNRGGETSLPRPAEELPGRFVGCPAGKTGSRRLCPRRSQSRHEFVSNEDAPMKTRNGPRSLRNATECTPQSDRQVVLANNQGRQ